MGQIEKQKIKWQLESRRGSKVNGEYEGEVKNGKPHGLGKWKWKNKGTVEGEWKNGQLNGKVVYYGNEYRLEYEAKEGKKNGKLIQYKNDGDRV